ncbi:MAG TPA: NAD(P)H-dependent oxidoreductase [Verrucomicrobiota bacterium]|nr:NAD(P)H-dependent oxidoreductase [Verrucomicrobiota bacterium]
MNAIATSDILHALHWRYATKRFDPTRKLPAETWEALEQALILSPSSFGLQPWKFVVVTDPKMKADLVPASWGQAQPADCSHFVVFTVRKDLDAAHVDRFLNRTAMVHGSKPESLAGYRKVILGSLEKARAHGYLDQWQTHQVYIALGQFMACAALLGIDTCPMEGIEPARYDELLGLNGSGFATVVACAVGYRADNDKYAVVKKVRFEAAEVVRHI